MTGPLIARIAVAVVALAGFVWLLASAHRLRIRPWVVLAAGAGGAALVLLLYMLIAKTTSLIGLVTGVLLICLAGALALVAINLFARRPDRFSARELGPVRLMNAPKTASAGPAGGLAIAQHSEHALLARVVAPALSAAPLAAEEERAPVQAVFTAPPAAGRRRPRLRPAHGLSGKAGSPLAIDAAAAAAEQARLELGFHAEQERLAHEEEEARRLEQERLALEEEERRLEQKRLAREAEERQLEQERLAREAEERRLEQERLAHEEEEHRLEQERLAREEEEQRLERKAREEERRRAEQARRVRKEEERRVEESKQPEAPVEQTEAQRIRERILAERERVAQLEQQKLDELKRTEEEHQAEQAAADKHRQADEARAWEHEQERLARELEQRRLEQEKAAEEERRWLEDQKRRAAEEEERQLEQERLAREEEERRLEQERLAREEEERRLEQERLAREEEERCLEQERLACEEEERRLEQERLDREALALRVAEVEQHLDRGIKLMGLGMHIEALPWLEKAAKLDTTNELKVHTGLAIVETLVALGWKAEALKKMQAMRGTLEIDGASKRRLGELASKVMNG